MNSETVAAGEQRPCTHDSVNVDFDLEAAQGLSSAEVRKRWPRFNGNCPDCGCLLIKYASAEQYIMGDY